MFVPVAMPPLPERERVGLGAGLEEPYAGNLGICRSLIPRDQRAATARDAGSGWTAAG
jgi:hypothetical protein